MPCKARANKRSWKNVIGEEDERRSKSRFDTPFFTNPRIVEDFQNNFTKRALVNGRSVDWIAMEKLVELPNEGGRPIDLMGDFDEVTTLKNLTRDGNYCPNGTVNHLNVHSRLLHHYITYNILPRTDHREIVHTLEIFLINSILMGKAINLGYILMTQMRKVGSKKTECLPYGMVLTQIFYHFEIPLHDESVKEKLMSPYDRTAVERMHWFFNETNGTWIYKGPEKASDPSVPIETHDYDDNEEGDPSTTRTTPPMFNFEEAFQLMNAHLDTLVVDFNAFKEDHGRQIQALQDS
ncbi:hypothetical protein PanWU01x14_172620 [Parasponia andersonii]|uniref:Uncharacterized protein n=1 Tax=Parasponia andersonii TaxID=3476 RepID=A0A2P5C911_PARAD|nr:hypothetical protein PanWU01x14_172620 [Parasponia andersonii]